MSSKNTLRLYLTANGDVAIKTFKEVGDASEETAEKVDKSAKKQEGSFAVVEGGASKLRGAIGMLAGTVGLGGLAFGIKDVIEAGEQWQQQQAQLVNALKDVHDYSAKTASAIRASSESLSVKGGFAGPEEISSITQFIRLTGSATRAIQLNKDAMNLARGAPSLGYVGAQRLLAQALTGNIGRLQKYTGIIEPVKTAEFALTQAHGLNLAVLQQQSVALGKLGPAWLKNQEILHNITPTMMQHAQLLDKQATATRVLQRVQERYAGAMSTFSKQTAGALSNLKNRFDLLGETIGRKTLPAITAIIGFVARHTTSVLILTGAVTGLALAFAAASAATKVWAAATVIWAGITGTASVVMDAYDVATIAWLTTAEDVIPIVRAWTAAQAFLNVMMDANPIGLVIIAIAALVAAIVIVVTHLKLFEAAARKVFSFFKSSWKTLAPIIGAPFAVVIGIVTHLKQAYAIAKKIVDLPSRVAHGIGHFITHPFGLHTGGLVRHMASGGPLGGYGGGDTVPTMLEPGEFVLRKEAVSNIGVQNLNSINAGGMSAGGGGGGQVYVALPLKIQVGSRVLAEQTAHFAAKKSSLSGSYVSG